MTTTRYDIEADRLTDEDRRRITSRIVETVAELRRPVTWADVPALERIAQHAIGCNAYDLRVVELEWINEQVRSVAGLAPMLDEVLELYGAGLAGPGAPTSARVRLVDGRVMTLRLRDGAHQSGPCPHVAEGWPTRHYGPGMYGHVDYFAPPALLEQIRAAVAEVRS